MQMGFIFLYCGGAVFVHRRAADRAKRAARAFCQSGLACVALLRLLFKTGILEFKPLGVYIFGTFGAALYIIPVEIGRLFNIRLPAAEGFYINRLLRSVLPHPKLDLFRRFVFNGKLHV